jgi:hypothetical protein
VMEYRHNDSPTMLVSAAVNSRSRVSCKATRRN